MARGGGKRHSPSQIVEKLRDGDALLNAGKTVSEVVQHLGISEQTYYRWWNLPDGMDPRTARHWGSRWSTPSTRL